MLSKQKLEEDTLVRMQLNDLSNKLRVVSEEFGSLKEEKESQLKDLERSEEKSALLREKLYMAVKKGKGLFQDREKLKLQLDEKNSEIEKLKLNLQQQESTISECRDQINRFSNDFECIPKLEADLVAMKDQRDQFEQFLLASNNMLQKVLESVDRIILPVDSAFKEPVEKVNWIAGYIHEWQDTKTHLEQELGNVKQEASALASKLAETQATMKSLEDALSVAEDKITQLADEKREVEVGKKNVEEELEKAVEETLIQTSKFAEACASRKSLEDQMSVAENNMSVLISEKEQAQASRATAVIELEQVKEEFASQTSKLTGAYKMIKSFEDALSQVEKSVAMLTEQNKEEAQASKTAAVVELEQVREEFASQTSKLTEACKTITFLEDALSQAEANVAMLTEQNNVVQVGRTTLENELQMLKDEAESQAVKLVDAQTTIKSLEDALLKAENDISVLEGEKSIAEQEVSTLNSKLNACMEELAGTNGSLESRSVELIGHLNDLQMFMKYERLLSAVKQCFERKFEGLQNMDLVIEDIINGVVGNGSATIEGSSYVTKSFTEELDNIKIYNNEATVGDADDITSCFRKTTEGFQLRNKILTDKGRSLLSPLQERELVDKITGIEITYPESVGDMEPQSSAIVKKLFSIVDSVTELPHRINLLEHEKQELQSILSTQAAEIEHLKGEVETHIRNKPDLEKMKMDFSEFTFGLEKIINMLESSEFVVDQKSSGSKGLLAVLERQIMTLHSEAENSKSKVQELGTKLLGSQKVVDELKTKVNLLDESLHGRAAKPEIVQERSIFEEPSIPTGSEISEAEDVGTLGQKTISPVPSAAHARTLRKGSTDHLTINIDSESARLINNEETDEDKGHAFKSLNTSGLIPKEGKMIADRIDGIWVSGGRVLTSRPGARLGIIAYCLLLHIWLLGTIL